MLVGTGVYRLPETFTAVRFEVSEDFETWLDEQHPGAVLAQTAPDPEPVFEISASGRPSLSFNPFEDPWPWLVYASDGPQTADPWFIAIGRGGRFATYPASGNSLRTSFEDMTQTVVLE